MKQHSYSFYSGWLSNEYRRRERFLKELAAMDSYELVRTNSVMDERERLIHEIEQADKDLTGKILGKVTYPKNLTIANFVDYMFSPTLVYELEYPRTDR